MTAWVKFHLFIGIKARRTRPAAWTLLRAGYGMYENYLAV